MATKNCKYCQSEIDKKAKVCPVCKRNLKGSGRIIASILLIFLGLALIVGGASSTNTTTGSTVNEELITLEEFNQIENGMSYEEVVAIIGSEGTLTSEATVAGYTSAIYTWYGNTITGANANVTFQNGKVIAKAQIGLN